MGRHQGDQVAHMRIGIDVMQPHPGTQTAQIAGQIGDMGAVAALSGEFAVQPIGAGILADDQQFAHARLDQLFGLAHHRMGGTADQLAAHIGDDAELAGVVAALGNLQIAVMAGRQADAAGRQQVDERIGRWRHRAMHRIQHLFILLRPGDGQNRRMRAGDIFGLGPQTAGDDDLAVFGQGLADRLQAFGLGAV